MGFAVVRSNGRLGVHSWTTGFITTPAKSIDEIASRSQTDAVAMVAWLMANERWPEAERIMDRFVRNVHDRQG